MKSSIKLSALGSALALAGLFMVGGVAQADTTVTATFNNVLPSTGAGGGGLFQWTRTDGTFPGTLLPDNNDAQFLSLCLEPNEVVSPGTSYTYDVKDLASAPSTNGGVGTTPMGVAKAGDRKQLFGGAYSVFGGSFSNLTGTPTDSQLRGALQIAVWEIVYEQTTTGTPLSPGGFLYDVTDGTYTVGTDATVNALANHWLENLSSYSQAQGLLALVKNGQQDQIVQVVPIPAAAWLFGSALMGVVALGRRRMRNGAQV
jgi:hypothetical protein